MIQRTLDIASWQYDRVQPLMDGTVPIEGAAARFHTSRIVTEIFEGMVRRRAYDVSELGLTYFLRTFTGEDSPFLLIPVFPNRAFRHGAVYINRHSGIRGVADLAGKRIGELALYGHDSGLVSKGILGDEHGFDPASAQWLIGGIDFPMEPIDFVAHPVPPGIDVRWCGKEVDLGKMLDDGEIDALFTADIPACVLQGSPNVGRLFDDYATVERDYYRRTGIFPIMHGVAVTRELATKAPGIVMAVYHAFCEAKAQTAERYVKGMTFNNMATMLPWFTQLVGDDRALLGDDWWPYGIEANRDALEAVLRYHHEQGLTPRQYGIEEIFVPSLLDT
ncbi:4,5-dihydroxyphthalate decarboxylase [Luteibacter yeojuensis]|nr:4,5-dihydroxyphthalate decarboxylase [Luteibacter yeojuensis]